MISYLKDANLQTRPFLDVLKAFVSHPAVEALLNELN
jgi:hypothetical protein